MSTYLKKYVDYILYFSDEAFVNIKNILIFPKVDENMLFYLLPMLENLVILIIKNYTCLHILVYHANVDSFRKLCKL